MKPIVKNLLSPRQEKYAYNIASGEYTSNTQAYIAAGYSPLTGARANACLVSRRPEFIARVKELRDKMLEPRITTAIERRVILSDIERKFETIPREAISAADIHNKMEKIYSETPLSQDNRRVINIFVMDGDTKELLGKIGDRTRQALTEGTIGD